MIAVVDAGMGNLRSVEKALAHVAPGQEVRVTADPADVARAERLVVPGQGAFGDCGRALSRGEPLGDAIASAIEAGTPYLGICLGMQVLFEGSEESPESAGLGVFRGRVVRIPGDLREPGDERRLKVPHMGWNAVTATGRPHPLLAATFAAMQQSDASGEGAEGTPFYFVHSFHAVPAEPFLVAATARYGGLGITAAVGARNVFAVQFHPEKSQAAGLAFLRAFVEWRC